MRFYLPLQKVREIKIIFMPHIFLMALYLSVFLHSHFLQIYLNNLFGFLWLV